MPSDCPCDFCTGRDSEYWEEQARLTAEIGPEHNRPMTRTADALHQFQLRYLQRIFHYSQLAAEEYPKLVTGRTVTFNRRPGPKGRG